MLPQSTAYDVGESKDKRRGSLDSVDDNSVMSEGSRTLDSRPPRRRLSLVDMMTPAKPEMESSGRYNFSADVSRITVGDIVSVTIHDQLPKEGIVIEKVNHSKVKVDFGEYIKECMLDNCVLIVRSDEFEVGDKVEARPKGSSLFFVGKVVKVHADKSIDVLMDGDDPDDVEYGIPAEEARKLMSRRSVVVNRWKRAFMLVVTANFFKRIAFKDRPEEKEARDAKDEK